MGSLTERRGEPTRADHFGFKSKWTQMDSRLQKGTQ